MNKEDYRKLIIKIVNEDKSFEWLRDIHSFVKCYPDNSNIKNKSKRE